MFGVIGEGSSACGLMYRAIVTALEVLLKSKPQNLYDYEPLLTRNGTIALLTVLESSRSAYAKIVE
jgi:hypothetical protein